MELTEIKDLYVEELGLLRRIGEYGKGQPAGKLDRVEKVSSLLLYRIYSNLYSSLLLTVQALKKRNIAFFQLPIGLILRCCFTDCLFALYIKKIGKDRATKELDLKKIEYANSLLERQEVYRDQVKSTSMGFDDELIGHMWELTIEDNFLGLLTLDCNKEVLTVSKQTKRQLLDEGFSNSKSVGSKDQKDFLIGLPEVGDVAMRLYHYYKYFSQYEHFSENGQGDVFASLKENGNDNIHLPSAIRALSFGIDELIKIKP